ncbi:16S rRNA (guanine(966)-N(2))-methyltransferase RsmD [Stappia indica]|uniref:16S rRNA (Guanine(966)-N(2))-methyltransferase RsmD n=1 Tax=Stappia indica TaxID=538381 RepID=A0A857CB50_9HYPH|nr:16S rRNA (guanine(966)-N(2))-methyltransferase RsmD [Stappia indica]QGZ36254.1 16S rRNA (guanine(966)-N(2))-methyltransferase RsmD [Stappia indica]
MRIVAGRFRGSPIEAPRGDATRPTSDRLRETLFNVLAHGHGDVLQDTRVLDLFAGSGALGLEALSRGARHCLFVEEASAARAAIRSNVEALGLTGATKIFRRDATRIGPVGTIAPFDLVFADPPYRKGLGEQALAACLAGGWLAPGALVVLEEDAKTEIAPIDGLEELDRRTVGESQFVIYRSA